MTKIAKLAAIGTLAVIALAGCGSDDAPAETPAAETSYGQVLVRVVDVDGRKIPCVVFEGYKAGGITCDWNASKP